MNVEMIAVTHTLHLNRDGLEKETAKYLMWAAEMLLVNLPVDELMYAFSEHFEPVKYTHYNEFKYSS